MLKKILIIMAVVALVLVPSTLHARNGNGNGGNGNGGNGGNGNGGSGCGGYGNGGNGTGPIHNILEGTPFSYTGTVVSVGYQQSGMVLATGEGEVTVYGLGSWRYWESLGVNLPDVGNSISVSGYTVDYNGVPRNILMSVIIDGVTVQLRDPETGLPLWRGGNGYGGNGNGGNGTGDCTPQGPRYDILGGTPFSLSGDVINVGFGETGGFGNGLTISTTDGNITLSGLGPWYYWESLGIQRPTVGDSIEVTGYTVVYNELTLNILMTVTINGQTVQLRDPETGLPLWGHGRWNQQ